MDNRVNIIFNNSNNPLTDASGNAIRNCSKDKSLGNKQEDIPCNSKKQVFTPWNSYTNPIGWQDIVLLLILKIFFVIIFWWNEFYGWVLVYVLFLACFGYMIYYVATFDYSFSHLVQFSNNTENPWFILWALVMNILFYIVCYLCGISFSPRLWVIFISEVCIWALFAYYCLADLYRVLLQKHLVLDVANAMGIGLAPACPSSSNSTSPTLSDSVPKKEVFNIAGDQFTYKDAQAVCKSYGAELATYEQIEQAYQDGAEWVNYGWSDGQYAYFPLQKSTWEKMSQDNSKNANGKIRPGISGGYFANPDMLFGANCFGIKPQPRSKDIMFNLPGNPPGSPEDEELNKKVKYYKDHADQVKIVGFNATRWFEDPKEKVE